MTDRKKKGIGFLISGVVFIVTGGLFLGLTATPEWLGIAMGIVGSVANIVGFAVVFPDTD